MVSSPPRHQPLDRRLAAVVRQAFVAELDVALDAVAGRIETALAEPPAKATQAKHLMLHQDAMLGFRQHRASWLARVRGAWGRAAHTVSGATGFAAIGALSLVDDDVVENKILASRLVLGLTDKISNAWNDLRLRMQRIEGTQELAAQDILRPDVLARIVVDEWVAVGLTREMWALAHEPVQDALTKAFQQACEHANATLVQHGVMPEVDLRSLVRRAGEAGGTGRAPAAAPTPPAPSTGYGPPGAEGYGHGFATPGHGASGYGGAFPGAPGTPGGAGYGGAAHTGFDSPVPPTAWGAPGGGHAGDPHGAGAYAPTVAAPRPGWPADASGGAGGIPGTGGPGEGSPGFAPTVLVPMPHWPGSAGGGSGGPGFGYGFDAAAGGAGGGSPAGATPGALPTDGLSGGGAGAGVFADPMAATGRAGHAGAGGAAMAGPPNQGFAPTLVVPMGSGGGLPMGAAPGGVDLGGGSGLPGAGGAPAMSDAAPGLAGAAPHGMGAQGDAAGGPAAAGPATDMAPGAPGTGLAPSGPMSTVHPSALARAERETRMMTAGTPMMRMRQRAQGVLGQLRRLLSDRVNDFDSQHGLVPSPGLAAALASPDTLFTPTEVRQGTGMAGAASIPGSDLAPAQAVERAAEQVRGRTEALKQKADTPSEKAIIEIVALMFQAILAEERIPASVRVWFARLQIPVLRVAMAEPEFFGSISHPARQLIDRMGACVLGFDAAAMQGSRLEVEIKRIVQVIEQYPETGRRVFQLVYEEFRKFLGKHLAGQGTARQLATVAQQVEQKEALSVQYTIELRKMLEGMPVAESIRDFMFKTWVDVLATAAVRHGAQDAATLAYKRAASDLVWVASAKPDRAERAQVMQLLPQLLAQLRQGLELLGMNASAQEAQIKMVNDAVAQAFMARGASGVSRAEVEQLAQRLADLEDVVSDDAAGDILLDAGSIELMLGIDASAIVVINEGGSEPTPPMRVWVRELDLGSWFLLDLRSHTEHVQYVWHSERGQLHLFQSNLGKHYLVQSWRLAAYLQAGLLAPLEDEALTVRATRDALA